MTKLKEDFEASGGEFKEWRIGDLFDIHPTKAYKMTNLDLFKNKGDIPVVTNSSVENGITGYVNLKPTEKGGIVTYSDTTTDEGIFYQPYDFVGYSHVQGVYPLETYNWNEDKLLYFVSLFKKSAKGRFDYASKFNRAIAKEMLVKLPTFNNEPSYSYMEQYISMLEEEKMLQVDKFLKDSGLNDTTLTAEEAAALEKFRNGEVRFEERKIGELFSCKTGDVDVQRCHLNGKGTIYINSGVTDLGIIGKTDMKARIFPANTITIDMFGNAYYRDFEYKMATHAHVFSLSHLDDKLNKENGLYICASLGYFTQLFSFNDMCNWSKMKDMKVCLPQRQDGDIDYSFMQHFISALEKLVMRGVVKYKDEMLNANLKTYSFGTDCYNVAAEPNLQNK